MDFSFDLLKRPLDHGSFISIFVLKLPEGKIIHFLLDEHENLVYLLDEVHLFDHFSLRDPLHVHLLSDFADFSLLVHLDLVRTIYLFGFSALLTVQVQ